MITIQGRYWATLVIIGVLSLSLKDGLNVIHSILHQIPNSIHYHLNPNGQASHDLDDHIHLKGSANDHDFDHQTSKSEGSDLGKELKINLFHYLNKYTCSTVFCIQQNLVFSDYKENWHSYIFCPPFPPPQTLVA